MALGLVQGEAGDEAPGGGGDCHVDVLHAVQETLVVVVACHQYKCYMIRLEGCASPPKA